MHRPLILPLFLLILCTSTAAFSASSYETLMDGTQIAIDPQTNRATRQGSGGTGHLWDGVHQLKDGSVITVREGVVISNSRQASNLASPQDPASGSSQRPSPCIQLMIKSCGFYGACRESQSCTLARQLVKLERDEALQASGGGSETSGRCLEAMDNREAFLPCPDDSLYARPEDSANE